MVGELSDLRRHAPWEASRISVPVVTVHGEHGAPHHRDSMRFLAGHLTSARNVEIPGARHFGPNTHAEAVAAVVEEVLDELGEGLTVG